MGRTEPYAALTYNTRGQNADRPLNGTATNPVSFGGTGTFSPATTVYYCSGNTGVVGITCVAGGPAIPVTAGVTLNSVSSTSPYTATATATGAGIGQRGFYWWIPPGPDTGWGG